MNFFLLNLLRFLSVYVGLTTFLFALSNFGVRHASFYARCLSSYLTLVICATYGVLVSALLRLTGHHRQGQYLTARSFHYTMRWTTGVEFVILSGEQHLLSTRPVVIIGNHQSELDVLLLGRIFPPWCSVTAKKSLKRVPFLGWFMALSGTVFIDRGNSKSALKAFEGAAEEMNTYRQSVFIFPEGTRSYAKRPELGPFKKGAFHLAVKAGVDVVPVVCANYWGVLAAGERRFRGGKIPVRVLDPISTKGLTPADVDDLTRTTRDKMLAELVALGQTPEGKDAARKI